MFWKLYDNDYCSNNVTGQNEADTTFKMKLASALPRAGSKPNSIIFFL